jgi:hypothetical protein
MAYLDATQAPSTSLTSFRFGRDDRDFVVSGKSHTSRICGIPRLAKDARHGAPSLFLVCAIFKSRFLPSLRYGSE